MALEFRILGPVEVACDGRVLDLGPPMQRALLAVLVVHANTVVSADRLLDELWAGKPPASARHALHVYVSNLRKALEPCGADSMLVTRRPGYLLHAAPVQLDAARFERSANGGHRALVEGRAREAAELLRAALAQWRGPALADLADLPFARSEIRRLEQLRLQALEARLDADFELGCHAELVEELEVLVADHPLRERFWAQLMLARYRARRQAEALHAYQSARDLLADQLGIDPSAELQRLHADILRQDPALAPIGRPDGRSRTPTPNNLPAQINSFIGRQRELTEIDQLLDTTRLVTLTGAGGAGKSRLALQVAAARLADHPDGVWIAELAPITDPRLVARTVASLLGVNEHPDRPVDDLLAHHLATAETLLVLDNCEHLVGDVAALLQRLLASCGSVRVLVTSQERLGVTGEALYRVPGLGIPAPGTTRASVVASADAARLFTERATAVQPGFRLSETTAGAIGRICRSLDGLPLAIELAAARVNAFGVEQIACRLDDRFRLLARGPRTALARHQTLRAVTDWSYGLLSHPERRLFERLAVFIGGFTLEAAEAVCAEPGDEATVELLSRLVDKSLVTAEETELLTNRYRLLETLRAYGLERLCQRGETDRLRDRHAAFYLTLAEQGGDVLLGPKQAAWLDRLETEHGNLRAALQCCLERGEAETAMRIAGALYPFWYIHGHYAEGWQWLARALAADGPAPCQARARALLGAATLAVVRGDLRQGTDAFEQAAVLCQDADDSAGLAYTLKWLGLVAIYTEELGQATALLQQSLSLARAAGVAWVEVWSLLFLASVALAQADYQRAAELVRQSETLVRELGDGETLAWMLVIRGAGEWGQGGYPQAAASLHEGLEAFRSLGGLWGLSLGLLVAAQLARSQCHWHRAATLLGASQALHEAIGAAMMPFVEVSYGEAIADVSSALGAHAFARAWRAGQGLSPDAAVDEAFQELATTRQILDAHGTAGLTTGVSTGSSL